MSKDTQPSGLFAVAAAARLPRKFKIEYPTAPADAYRRLLAQHEEEVAEIKRDIESAKNNSSVGLEAVLELESRLAVIGTKKPLPSGFDTFQIELVPLNGAQVAEYDRLGASSIKPPLAKRPKTDKPEDAYDYDNPEYIAACTKARRAQIAYAFQKGVVSQPGEEKFPESLEQAADWIFEKLPESIIQTILAQILEMSAGRVQLASFTTAAA